MDRRDKYLALFRGVNVGGKNKLLMKDLAAIFNEAGCQEVQTFIQSGNVIFSYPTKRIEALQVLVCSEIEKRFAFQTQMIVRSCDQLRKIAEGNPFAQENGSENMLHVLFLAGPVNEGGVQKLDPSRSPPDEFIVSGQEIFLRIPNGAGNTKLTNAYFDSKLSAVSTGRNWRTVKRLNELMAGL